MPKKPEVLKCLEEMKSDLMNEPNLLKNKDAMEAWDSFTKLVQNKEKGKFQPGFEYLENVIHRDFRVPPGVLLLQRKRYASGKELILSLVEPSRPAVQKSTGASPVPPSLTAKEKKKKTTPMHGIQAKDGIIHVARPRTASGSREDDNEVKLYKLQHDYKEMERQLNETQAKLRKTERNKEDLEKRQERFEEIERQLKDTQENLRKSETDKEYWVGRMSKVTGDKLTRDNPDIADLSDPNRPTKLGEKYSLLYDNEWTDAMEKLTETTEKSQISERRGIDILIDILKKIHTLCIECADDQMNKLRKAVILESRREKNGIMDIPIEVQRSLQDAQKQTSLRSLPAVQEMVRTELESFKDQYGAIPVDKITPFVNKCTEICWGMVTQSPRMDFLFPEEGTGKRFDKDKFKEFTQSGDKMDYLVWPAMVIQKQGSLIAKGSVQAIARHT